MGVDQLQLDPGAERLVYRRLMALPAPLRAAWGAAALGLLVWAGVWAVIDLDPGWWDCHDSAYRTLLDLGLYGSLGVGGIDLVLAFAATITRPGGARPWGALVPVVFALLWGAIALGGYELGGYVIGASDGLCTTADDPHGARRHSAISAGDHPSPAPFWMDEGSMKAPKTQQRSPTY